ncbi:MAG: glycosyltransferase family 9 protein [Opitutaceae bacterium]
MEIQIPRALIPSVLVIRRRYLGDIVLLGPVLRSLREHWPEAPLRVLALPEYAEVLALNPDVTETLIVPRLLSAWPGFLARLRRLRFTHVFNFDNTEGTAALARWTAAPFRLGLHHGGYPLKWRRAYTHAVDDPKDEHEARSITAYFLKALAPAGVPATTGTARLVPRDTDVAWVKRFVGAAGPVLLVHPGSRSAWRVWPAERFAALCDRAQEELGAQVVLAGGPADREILAAIRSQAKTHLFAWDRPLSVPRFAALARVSSVLFCHDSGPMHIAAAVGTPVVALYGSQNAALFRPSGEGHLVVQPTIPCGSACLAPGTCAPTDSYRSLCVRRITVNEAFAALSAQWKRATAGNA